jgi:hypothetical protein
VGLGRETEAMSRITKGVLGALLALAFIVPAASARPRVIIRGGFYGPGFYGPGWYGPYGGYYVPGERTDMGSVKIDTRAKDVMVYVDGGYAGTVGKLKTFSLKAGQHDIELRDPSGHGYYQEHINVLAGKTLNLQPDAR